MMDVCTRILFLDKLLFMRLEVCVFYQLTCSDTGKMYPTFLGRIFVANKENPSRK